MKKKKCTKCGEVKDVSEFYKCKGAKNDLRPACKICTNKGNKLYAENNKDKVVEYQRQYYVDNKERITKRDKEYYENNKEEIDARKKKYHRDNKVKINLKSKQYYKDNSEKLKQYGKQYTIDNRYKINLKKKKYCIANKETICLNGKKYYRENKQKLLKHNKDYYHSNARYDLFVNKLTVDEVPKLHDDGISLEVKCRYCGKYFIPMYEAVKHRVDSLNGNGGENYLYCSEDCKQACPVYKRVKYPKGFKQISENEGQEGNDIWRQEVIKRNIKEYGQLQCEICGNTNENELSAHHEKPRKTHPEMSLDPDNGWMLCSFGKGNNCHLKYGHPKETNCSTAKLAKLTCGRKQKCDIDG